VPVSSRYEMTHCFEKMQLEISAAHLIFVEPVCLQNLNASQNSLIAFVGVLVLVDSAMTCSQKPLQSGLHRSVLTMKTCSLYCASL
jgi:hypothetical protein